VLEVIEDAQKQHDIETAGIFGGEFVDVKNTVVDARTPPFSGEQKASLIVTSGTRFRQRWNRTDDTKADMVRLGRQVC
jgi:hypothetical protein